MENFKTKSGKNIEIRLATFDDIQAIQNLNQKWTINSLDLIDKENGFLFCETYRHDDLKKIITANELAIASFQDQVIGYYINDNYSHLLEKYITAINKMKQEGIIASELNVSKRTQIVIEKEFHRMGLPSAMLDFLKPYLIHNYDLLFSIGRNDNPKRIAHQSAGWEIIYENEQNYYCIYNLNTNNL